VMAQGKSVLKVLVVVLLAFFAVGCSQEDMLRKIAPQSEQDKARTYIEQLRHRDFSEVEKAMDPSIAGDLKGGLLEKMADAIPAGEPTSVKLVGANQFSSNQVGTTLNLTYEFQFRDKFLLINVARKTKNGVEKIIGFRVQGLTGSLEAQNRFTLAVKSALQYGVLARLAGSLKPIPALS
jgi:hypothetical protein